jgi:hypothetical protein
MKALVLFLFPFLFSLATAAQTTPVKISSTLKNKDNEVIPNATVRLLNAKDATPVNMTSTDGDGKFLLAAANNGNYLISISAVGYKLWTMPVKTDGKTNVIALPVIVLLPDRGNNLAGVVIQAKKPLIQMEMDKTVVNVEAMISSTSSNTLEVLEKTPGVTVSANGDIGLNGRTGVLVLIDGRSKYLSAQDLALYLKSIPGALLDRIELIDNPSSRYDAAGNAVINIRLKKNRSGGFTGGISTGFTQGRYLRSNNSLNLNYNYKKINVFGNLGYTYDKGYTDDRYDRRFYTADGQPSSTVALFNSQLSRSTAINSSLGLDYSATENTTYGFQVNLNDSRRHEKLGYNSDNSSMGKLDSLGRGNTRGSNHRTNLGTSMSFIHKFGKTGRELSADVNYLNNDGHNEQSLQNFMYTAEGVPTGYRNFFYDLPSGMNVYTVKADYVHPLKDKAKLEAGFKSSWVNNNNVSDYYRVTDEQQVIDNGQSNHFKYRENINAGYVNAQKSWRYFGVQLGMRVENTVAKGQQLGNEAVEGSRFKKNYTRLFPAVFLNYKLDTSGRNSFSLAITRRINRPNYQLLNEFLIARDQYSYTTGNSMVNPTYQYRYEVKYQHKQWLRMALSYNRFTDVIFQTTRVVDDIFITRPENVAKGYMVLLNTGLSFSPAKWWYSNTEVLLSRMGLNGNAYGVKLNPSTYVARINILDQFQLGAGWSAELGGYYASRDLNGQTFTGGMYRVNTGLQKKIMKGQGSLRFGADDIFHTWVYHNNSISLARASYAQVSSSDTQRFGFAFSYRFGKDIFSRKNKHQNNALDEEKGRM